MDIPLEINFQNIDPSEFVEARIRERVNKLHRYYDRINSCRVAVRLPHKQHQKGNIFHVRIEVRVPGAELVVSRAPGDINAHQDVYVAIRDAFDAADRQLEEFSRKQRGEVKRHEVPLQGKVLRTFADHGFIGTNDGREIYFHRNSVVEGRFEDIEEGATVELAMIHGESPIGPQATTVRPIRPTQYIP
jgi:ribosomal subunit interface protein